MGQEQSFPVAINLYDAEQWQMSDVARALGVDKRDIYTTVKSYNYEYRGVEFRVAFHYWQYNGYIKCSNANIPILQKFDSRQYNCDTCLTGGNKDEYGFDCGHYCDILLQHEGPYKVYSKSTFKSHDFVKAICEKMIDHLLEDRSGYGSNV